MSNFTHLGRKRRQIILKGISQGLKYSEIAAQLGVNRWTILNHIKYMKKNRDPELKQAQKTQEQIFAKKHSVFTSEKKYVRQNKRFLNMTGMTLQEKTFRNMINFYKPELIKILSSRDQHGAIMKLPKSIRRTLIHNEIIVNKRNNREISQHVQKNLTSIWQYAYYIISVVSPIIRWISQSLFWYGICLDLPMRLVWVYKPVF